MYMFFALGDPWMIHFDPRYCLDLPSSTMRLVTTFRFLWHELQSLALVELTGWNMLKQMKLKHVETDEVETWWLFKKLWFALQIQNLAPHIMPTNMKGLAKENRGYPWKFKQRDQWEIQTETNRTIDVRKIKIHGGLPKKKRIGQTRMQMSCHLPVDKKKCGWPSPWFSHQADADGCRFPPREHVFLTYHPETKNGLPKCPSIYY